MLSNTYLNHGTAMLGDVDTSLNRDLSTAGVNDEIDRTQAALSETELLAHGPRVALRVLNLGLALVECRWLVDVGRSVTLREVETLLDDVHSDDTAGTESFCNSHTEETNGTGTEDDNILTSAKTTNVGDRVNADRERLHLNKVSGVGIIYIDDGTHHGTILKSQMVGKLVAKVSGDWVVASECAVVGRSGSEHDVWAELMFQRSETECMYRYVTAYLIATELASIADSACRTRLHSHTVAGLEVLDLRANY